MSDRRWSESDLKAYMTRRLASEQRARERMAPITEAQFQEKVANEINPNLGAVVATKTERHKVPALDGAIKERRQRKGSVEPRCRVLLISCRHRELDDDSNIYSLKPLRDAVAASFGLDDADGRIQWEYGQQTTRGEQGVIVRIEQL